MECTQYYAIKGGKNGDAIVNSWKDALPLIKGVRGVRHKKFSSRAEADLFISPPQKTPQSEKNTSVELWVDGATSNNGLKTARGGNFR